MLVFWKALGFEVAYDIVKDGVTGICHSAGFAVTAFWSKVRDVLALSHRGSVLFFSSVLLYGAWIR